MLRHVGVSKGDSDMPEGQSRQNDHERRRRVDKRASPGRTLFSGFREGDLYGLRIGIMLISAIRSAGELVLEYPD